MHYIDIKPMNIIEVSLVMWIEWWWMCRNVFAFVGLCNTKTILYAIQLKEFHLFSKIENFFQHLFGIYSNLWASFTIKHLKKCYFQISHIEFSNFNSTGTIKYGNKQYFMIQYVNKMLQWLFFFHLTSIKYISYAVNILWQLLAI